MIDRNWRGKFCEIDIISHHKETIYFTEVKYRKKDDEVVDWRPSQCRNSDK
jgi:Holliday junction resolvase-like predicted endonuclease